MTDALMGLQFSVQLFMWSLYRCLLRTHPPHILLGKSSQRAPQAQEPAVLSLGKVVQSHFKISMCPLEPEKPTNATSKKQTNKKPSTVTSSSVRGGDHLPTMLGFGWSCVNNPSCWESVNAMAMSYMEDSTSPIRWLSGSAYLLICSALGASEVGGDTGNPLRASTQSLICIILISCASLSQAVHCTKKFL